MGVAYIVQFIESLVDASGFALAKLYQDSAALFAALKNDADNDGGRRPVIALDISWIKLSKDDEDDDDDVKYKPVASPASSARPGGAPSLARRRFQSARARSSGPRFDSTRPARTRGVRGRGSTRRVARAGHAGQARRRACFGNARTGV